MRAIILVLLALGAAPARAADAEGGKAIYAAKCLACHGEQGKGDGPAAAALPKPVPDLTKPEFWKDMTDDRLKSSISNGKPNGVMRPFPMKPEQMDNLVAYLRTLEPK